MSRFKDIEYQYFPFDREKTIEEVGQQDFVKALDTMLLIRNFELRAEAAYQQGKVGGFFHSYVGQEAIQTACVQVFGQKNWWVATYRCHALALLTGATPNEIMAELYGRATGNARGRGGSMHLYTDRMLGGFAIVGGHLPIAIGASFALKYKEVKEELAICFLGDGAVAQGAFHESMNLASLWDLPTVFVIENNKWGMGTHQQRALRAGFAHVRKETLETGRPVLIEVVTERFKGHSISDPGLYRSKEELKEAEQHDPIQLMRKEMEKLGFIDEEKFKEMDKKNRQIAVDAMQFAEDSPWPDPVTLEEDVLC